MEKTDERFILQPSQMKPNHFVCTDTQNAIVCVFENHKFNETQHFTLLNGDTFKTADEAMSFATYMREMGDWLVMEHPEKIF